MADICLDKVVFYSNDNLLGLEKLKKDIKKHFQLNCKGDMWIGKLLEINHIDISNFSTRGSVFFYEIEENKAFLELEVAWDTLYTAYFKIAQHYGISFVVMSEEPQSDIYLNTDISGDFFDSRYVAHISDYDGENHIRTYMGDEDCYFRSFDEVLQYFSQTDIVAETIEQLNGILKPYFVKVYEFSSKI